MGKKHADTINEVMASLKGGFGSGVVAETVQDRLKTAEKKLDSGLANSVKPVAQEIDPSVAMSASGFIEVDISLLDDSEAQYRIVYDPATIDDLAKTLAVKQITPIRIRKKANGRYEIIAGHRRLRAARIIGKPTLTAQVVDVDDARAALELILSNESQEEVGDYERAKGYETLKKLGIKQSEIADSLGVNRSLVSNRLQFLKLPEAVLAVLEVYPRAYSYVTATVLLEILAENPELVEFAAEGTRRCGTGDWKAQILISDLRRRQSASKGKAAATPFSVVDDKGRTLATIRSKPDGHIAIRLSGSVDQEKMILRLSKLLQDDLRANPGS